MDALSKQHMERALSRLDEVLPKAILLTVGGGGAMILAHGFPLVTHDIDGVPKGMELDELDGYVKQIAKEQSIAPDWLNPYFATFVHTLPSDYKDRIVEVYSGQRLTVHALGKEEMLIMKCFAHRAKDIGHAKFLIKAGTDTQFVEKHIESLAENRIPGADRALDFLDDIMEQI